MASRSVGDPLGLGTWWSGLFTLCLAIVCVLSLLGSSEGAVRGATRSATPPAPAPRTPAPTPAPASAATDPVRALYDELITLTATAEGVDANLVRAIITVESGFDPAAVSRKGAKGLMQLMPETASRYAVRDPFDPVANVRGGVRYLRFLHGMFPGQLDRVLAAYNAGENAVLRYNGIPPYRETRDYVQRVLANYTRRGEAPGGGPSRPEAGAANAGEGRPAAPTLTVYRVANTDSSVTYTNVRPTETR